MIQFVIEALGRLAVIPGLGFLSAYQQQLQVKLGRINQKIGDIKAKRDDTMEAVKYAKDMPRNVKGTKKRG